MLPFTYPGPESIHRHVMANGITLLVYENHSVQSVVMEGMVRAGSLHDPVSQAGLADYTAAMLTRGTVTYDFDNLFEQLESVNAYLSYQADWHQTYFAARSLAEDLPLLLDIMAETLRHPTFPERHVELMRGQMETSLHLRDQDSRARATMTMHELLYPDHPYGRAPDGYLETIAAIGKTDLSEFHRRYYGPEHMILVIVGAINALQAIEAVESRLHDWITSFPRPETPLPTSRRPEKLIRQEIWLEERHQADIVMGLPGPQRSAPDFIDYSIMNTILGVFGMMGRLGQRVREQEGLAYYIESHVGSDLGPLPWSVATGVAPENIDRAIDLVLAEIRRIQDEPVSLSELEDSLAYRAGSMPVRLETNQGLAGNIASMELFDLGLDYLQGFSSRLQKVTPDTVQAAAQKYLSSKQMAIAIARPQPVA